MRYLTLALVALLLVGCAGSRSGPGVECDPADRLMEDVNPTPGSADAKAYASGDIDQTNQPSLRKYVPSNPNLIQGRGTGDVDADTDTRTTDGVAGAPNVFQCLIGTTPTAQAQAQASQAVAEWKAYAEELRAYRGEVARCRTMPSTERQCEIRATDERIQTVNTRIESAERVIAQGGPQWNYWDLSGDFTVVQIAASGSSTNEPGKGALDPEAQKEMAAQTPQAIEKAMARRNARETEEEEEEKTPAQKVEAARALGCPPPPCPTLGDPLPPTPPSTPLPAPPAGVALPPGATR